MNHSCAAEEVSLSFTFSWSRRSEVVFDANMFSLTFDPSAKYTGTEVLIETKGKWGKGHGGGVMEEGKRRKRGGGEEEEGKRISQTTSDI